MRGLLLVAALSACTDDLAPPPEPSGTQLDKAWAASIQHGDLIVVVPGTSAVSGLGERIRRSGTDFDARAHIVFVDPIEGAVAAAQRAGITDEDLEAGAVTFGLWGAGLDGIERFTYVSAGGLRIPFEVIGGATVCGVGGVPENIGNYNAGNADVDARDLYTRTQTWLAAHPATNVSFVAHSWGGIVAQFFATHLATLVDELGPLAANPALVVAAGVPSILPGFTPHGPGFRTVDSKGDVGTAAIKSYEIDRPDDPAHSFDPADPGEGHHYVIMFGAEYRGFYGITTDELSCGDIPGICPPNG
jgi:hypothetical protein